MFSGCSGVFTRSSVCPSVRALFTAIVCIHVSRPGTHTYMYTRMHKHTHAHTHTHIVKQFYSRSPLEVFEVLYTFTYTHIYSCFLICTHRIYIEGTKVQRVTWAKVSHGLKLLCLTYIDSVYVYIYIYMYIVYTHIDSHKFTYILFLLGA